MDTEEIKVVNVGVDSLWLNVCYAHDEEPDKRPLDQGIAEKLTALQEAARQAEKPLPTEYVFNGAALLMYGNGGGLKSPWRFILRNDFIEVKIGSGKKNGHVAKVRLSAEYLWSERDVEYCIACAECFLMAVLDAEVWVQVSELHLCADITGYDFSRGNWLDGFIRRSKLRPHFGEAAEGSESAETDYIHGPDEIHLRYRPITGFDFGTHASAVSACVYNKTTYIKHKAPDTVWFQDIWREHGWDGTSEVWRVEFRLKRDALHAMSIESAYEVPKRLEALPRYI